MKKIIAAILALSITSVFCIADDYTSFDKSDVQKKKSSKIKPFVKK